MKYIVMNTPTKLKTSVTFSEPDNIFSANYASSVTLSIFVWKKENYYLFTDKKHAVVKHCCI